MRLVEGDGVKGRAPAQRAGGGGHGFLSELEVRGQEAADRQTEASEMEFVRLLR